MKKCLVVLLAAIMMLGLVACAGEQPAESSAGGETQNSAMEDSRGSEEEGTQEIQKVVMAFLLGGTVPNDVEVVQDAINEITRESIGIEVELQVYDISSYQQSVTLALSGGESIDIVSAAFMYPMLVQQGYLSDLEENDLLQTYGQGIIDAVGQEYVDACRIDGVLYGLPNNRDMAQGRGCTAIATKYLEGIDYEIPSEEIIYITQEELDEIYAKLHEKYPDKEIIRPLKESMETYCTFDKLGGSAFGVLLNYGEGSTVENLFTSDTYKEYCERMYHYNQLGYISQDAVTDSTGVGELVSAGKLISYISAGKPGVKSQETSKCGTDMTIFQIYDDFVSSAAVTNYPWVITANTADAVAAMKFLNECYTNPEVANLLSWGIQDVHYQVQDSGLITFAEGIDATTSGWNHSFQWLLPNQYITHVWEGNDINLWDNVKAFNEESKKSTALGFSFRSENVATELTAVQNVYEEYQKSLEFGMVNPDTGIQEMNDKMMSAGLQKIMDEKQIQLNKFMSYKQ